MIRGTKRTVYRLWGLAIAFILMIACLLGGVFALRKTNTKAAEIATDYMEEMQALTYTTTVNGEEVTLSYRLYVPHDYDAAKAYPLFTMLHGHGAQGSDNETQLNVFKPLLSRLTTVEQLERDPAIIVVPQCRADHKWVEVNNWTGHYSVETFDISPDLQAVASLTDELLETYNIDTDRLYITGHSMGGLAVWDMLARFPDRYAAAVPISGAGNDLTQAETMKNVNIWAIHGALDVTVGVDVSRDMVSALQAVGGWVKYTEYPEGNHSIGTVAYQNEEDMVDFFLSSRKGVKNSYVGTYSPAEEAQDKTGAAGYTFVNNASQTTFNGMHAAAFDALSVNFPTTSVSGLVNITLPFAQAADLSGENAAVRVRIQTVVPVTGREGLRFDLMTDTAAAYMTGGATAYRVKGGNATASVVQGSTGSGASIYILDTEDVNGTRLFDGYVILPVASFNTSDASAVTSLRIRTNPAYSQNIWNFGAVEYGTVTADGVFSSAGVLWQPYNEDGAPSEYTADEGVDAAIIHAGEFTGGETKAFYLKNVFDSALAATDTLDISAYDGVKFYIDNTDGAAKSFQLFLYDESVAAGSITSANAAIVSKNGLAIFLPDEDCAAYKGSVGYRSSFVPAGFKGWMYLPFTLNGDSEAGVFQNFDNSAPDAFPEKVYNQFLIYYGHTANEDFCASGAVFVADGEAFLTEAYEASPSVSTPVDHDAAIMVQGSERLAPQFELWTNNTSGVSFATCNETNEVITGGTALAVAIENLNDSPFIFSVTTWNSMADMVLLGGNIREASVKLVGADGEVTMLMMRDGYITIPAKASGTLILPYVGGLEVTSAKGGSTTYPLGYPVKGIFRVIFNAYDATGEGAFLLGQISVVAEDGSVTAVRIGGQDLSAAAAANDDEVYKKDRAYIAYSGAVKTYTASSTQREGATLSVNEESVIYGQDVTFTVTGLGAGDSVIGATLNGEDVFEDLVYADGKYTFTTQAKEDLVFAVTLDSDPKYYDVTVTAGANGGADISSERLLEGSSLTVTFTAQEGYCLQRVTVNGAEQAAADGKLTVTVTGDMQISATFAPIEYTIVYELGGGENAAENPATYTVESDTIVLAAPQREHYEFAGWYSGNELVTSIAAGSMGDLTLTARWTAVRYTIGYEFNSNMGTISPVRYEAEWGEEITFTVQAKDGYSVSEVSVNGTAVAVTDGLFTVTVEGDTTISVSFAGDGAPVTPADDDGNDPTVAIAVGCSVGGVVVVAGVVCAVIFIKKKKR